VADVAVFGVDLWLGGVINDGPAAPKVAGDVGVVAGGVKGDVGGVVGVLPVGVAAQVFPAMRWEEVEHVVFVDEAVVQAVK